MNMVTVNYTQKSLSEDPNKLKEFKKKINISNVAYFYYFNDTCLYIGETGTSLKDRCYTHSPKQSRAKGFQEANTIKILKLDDCVDNIERQAIESVFILVYRPKYNQKT